MTLSWSEIALSAATLLYFMGVMGGVFLVGPWFALRREADLDLAERFWSSFLPGTAYWIALATVLAPLRFHDAPGLLAASLLLMFAYGVATRQLNIQETWDRQFNGTIRRFLDFLELSSLLSALGGKSRKYLNRRYCLQAWGPWDTPRTLIWIVFLYAAYLRIHDSLVHYSYGFPDQYIHLVLLKEFSRGNLFVDGVQPRGFEALLSVSGALCGLEPAVLYRFVGGVMGALLSPALFFLLRQCRLPWSGALVGTALLAVCSPFQWSIARQTASFPQEAALVFAIAALGFGVRYLRLGKNRDCRTFACGSFAAWSIHSIVGEMLLFASVLMAVDCLWRLPKTRSSPLLRFHEEIARALEEATWRSSAPRNDMSVKSGRPPDGKATLVGHVVLAALLAAVGGNFYLIVGRLLHRPASFGPHDYTRHPLGIGAAGTGQSASVLRILIQFMHPASARLILPMVALAMFLALFGIIRRKEAFPSPLFMALWALALFGGITLDLFTTLRAPISPDAALVYLTLPVCGVAAHLYSLGLEPLLGRFRFAPKLRVALASLALVLLVFLLYQPPPAPLHRQYEEQVRLYYQLSAQLPPGWWTIIGQEEDYQLALHRGFTLRAAEFVRAYPPSLQHPIFPTPYLFILVQKRPLPLPEGDGSEKTTRARDNRVLLNWLQVYSKGHSDLRLYEDTPNVTIYVLYHPEALRHRIQAGMLPE